MHAGLKRYPFNASGCRAEAHSGPACGQDTKRSQRVFDHLIGQEAETKFDSSVGRNVDASIALRVFGKHS